MTYPLSNLTPSRAFRLKCHIPQLFQLYWRAEDPGEAHRVCVLLGAFGVVDMEGVDYCQHCARLTVPQWLAFSGNAMTKCRDGIRP